jgi:plastocyanin
VRSPPAGGHHRIVHFDLSRRHSNENDLPHPRLAARRCRRRGASRDGPTSAAPAQSLTGTVGPGFTITLTLGGKKVTKLKAHTPYRFVIRDRATIHDFHLRGPGIDRVLTSVAFQGTKSYTLTLKKGTYRFFCDPHAGFMHGSFRVA